MPKEQIELANKKLALFPELVEALAMTIVLIEAKGRFAGLPYLKAILEKAEALMEGK